MRLEFYSWMVLWNLWRNRGIYVF